TYSLGLATGRDAWAYNFSRGCLGKNVSSSIDYYNGEVARLRTEPQAKRAKLVNVNENKFSWKRNAFQDLGKSKKYYFSKNKIQIVLYRPLSKQWAYIHRDYNAMLYKILTIFPDATIENLVISISCKGSQNGSSVLMSKSMLD